MTEPWWLGGLPPGYRVDLVQCGGDDDGEYYWHLWQWNRRVNGGLSEGYVQALQDASLAARRDFNQSFPC